jgi:uncharacterized caspase-like protein
MVSASSRTFVLLFFFSGAMTTAGAQDIDTDDLVAQQTPRVALVIGVQNYPGSDADPKGNEVQNALNDADLIAKKLAEKEMGFSVKYLPDPSYDEMTTALEGFSELVSSLVSARGSVIALIYFAGHGFQAGPLDYVAPKSASLDGSDDDRVTTSFDLSKLIESMPTSQADAGPGLGLPIVILDSCRNTLQVPPDSGSATRKIPEGRKLIAFAAAYGHSAQNGKLDHSPFTTALSNRLATPGKQALIVLNEVSTDVAEQTKAETPDWIQIPDIISAEVSDFTFIPNESDRQRYENLWRTARHTRNRKEISRYLIDYPDSPFAGAAARWLSANPK